MSDNKNPYAAAADAYGTTAAIAGGRDLEGKVLLKSATQLEELMTRLKNGETVPVRESGEILEYNQKLWQFFVNAMKNDEKDRHVLAAAVRAHADCIVTNNLKHFPKPALKPFGIECLSAQDFLVHQYHLDPDCFISVLTEQARDSGQSFAKLLELLSLHTPKLTALIKP